MYKVLFLPLNYGSVVQTGWYDAFRENGATLEIFDYMQESIRDRRFTNTRRKLQDQVKKFRPDVMFLQIQHTNVIDYKTILDIKKANPYVKIINWTGDVRKNVPVTFLRIGDVSDLNLISSTGQLEMFRKVIRKPVDYLQIGYNPKIYFPIS